MPTVVYATTAHEMRDALVAYLAHRIAMTRNQYLILRSQSDKNKNTAIVGNLEGLLHDLKAWHIEPKV